jgi:polysaccharide biosynthesis protein PslH
MRILFVTLGAPTPLDRGARIRDFELIRRVARSHEVTWLALIPPYERGATRAAPPDSGAAFETVDLPGSPARHPIATGRQLARRRPAAALPYLGERAERRIGELAVEYGADVVQLEHSFLAPYIDAVPDDCAPVLSLHNVGFRQYERMGRAAANRAAATRYRIKSAALRRLELAYAPRFDRVIAVSPDERDALLAAEPGLEVEVIENGVDLARIEPLPESGDPPEMLFVGNFGYAPNVGAVLDFEQRILPLIRRRVPGVRLTVVGPQPPRSVSWLAHRGAIEVTGPVENLEPYYRRATISVAPLLAGGGSRIKILESMAYGRCVVTTTVGCEGLGFNDGEEMLIADEPAAFAEKTVRLLGEVSLRAAISARARQAVERSYNWDAIAERLLGVYAELERGNGG